MPLAHSKVQVLNEESILIFNTYLSSTELLLILGTGLKNIFKKIPLNLHRYKANCLLHSALSNAGVRFTSPPCTSSKTKPDGNYEDELRCLKGTIKTRQANYAR